MKSLSDLAHLLSNSNNGTVYILQKGKSDHIIGASKGPTSWPLVQKSRSGSNKHSKYDLPHLAHYVNLNNVEPYVTAMKDGVVSRVSAGVETGQYYIDVVWNEYTPSTPAAVSSAKTKVLVKVKSWKDKMYAPEHTALFTDKVQPTLDAVAAKLAAMKEPTIGAVNKVADSKVAAQMKSVMSLGWQNLQGIAWSTVASGVHHVASLVNLVMRSMRVSLASYGRIVSELQQIHSIRRGILLNHMLMLRGVGDNLHPVSIKGEAASVGDNLQQLSAQASRLTSAAADKSSGESTPAGGRFFLIESTEPGTTIEVVNSASSDSNMSLSEMLQGGSMVIPPGSDIFAGDVHRRGLSEIEVDEADWVNVKRVGGIGDVLSGVVTLFCAWQEQAAQANAGTEKAYKHRDPLMALFLASTVVKRASRSGEAKRKRGLSPTDVIEALPGVTEEIYPLRARAGKA